MVKMLSYYAFVWLDLVYPASWMHRATRWRHVCLSWADASASSQVSPILWRSFFATPFQLVLGLPGFLLNPTTSHCSACFGMCASSILMAWPSHRILLSRITFSISVFLFCSVLLHSWLYPFRWCQECLLATCRGLLPFFVQCDRKRP